jgi:transcriptional regulator with XRE-family HTH domain
MTDIRKILAENIKAYRKKRGFSQIQLAEKAGLAPHYLAMIETCKNFPSADMIERIAKGLGQDPINLFSSYATQQDWKETVVSDIKSFVDKKFIEIGRYVDKKLNE